ncbi:MAG: hypothetical protein HWE39_16415 [Oceanospirillaceae bacterium]|nr:hypothetical protein [Oceanospirillaceae bacterium]
MFNGLDELEEFAKQLAPLTPEETAAWQQRRASTEVKKTKAEPVQNNTADIVVVQETAPKLGTVPEPVSETVSEMEPPPAQSEWPQPAPEPERQPEVTHKEEAPLPESADDGEYAQESKPTPLQKTVTENEAVQQAGVLEPEPVLASQPESKPGPTPVPGNTARSYARYVIVGGVVLLGLVAVLL